MGLLFDFVTHNNGSCGQYALATPTPMPSSPCSLLPCLACLTLPLWNGVFIVRPDIFNANHFMLIARQPASPPAWPPARLNPVQRRVQLNIIVKNKTTARSPTVAAKPYLPIAVACHLLLTPCCPLFLSTFLLSFIVADRSQRKLLVDTHTHISCKCVWGCVCWPTARQFVFSLSGQLKAF